MTFETSWQFQNQGTPAKTAAGKKEQDNTQLAPGGLRCVVTPAAGLTPSGVLGREASLVFPAVVNTLELTETATFGDYDSVGAGSFSIRRAGDENARELKTLTMEVYASDTQWPFLQDGSPSSWAALRSRLRKILHARFPVHLTARNHFTMLLPGESMVFDGTYMDDIADLDMNVTFRNLSIRSEPGQPDSRYFSIEIHEHRVIRGKEEHVGYARMGGKGTLPQTVSISAQSDVTMGDLAVRFYGQFTLYRLIQRANSKLAHIPANSKLSDHKITRVRIPAPPSQNV